ncbi:Transcription factor IIA, alpha/beta subunit [Dillenia turbinata]|uniref:Transcription factor IIA, alpha/beta subunit n=1 Tax=Dillenia turbinata TaxID=194707 RepID=A0AAN8ZFG0_9MAGN
MATSSTSTVYVHVIEDVINKVREEFISNGGPGESVLNELQGIWEMKMMQAGAILGPIERSSAPKPAAPGAPTPVHDLNVPYEGTEEYETPTAEMLFPPTPLQTPIPTPLPGTADSSLYNIPTGPSEYNTPNDSGGAQDVKAPRPSTLMPPPPSPWMHQRPPLDVNVAYVEGREEVDRGNSHQPLTQDFFTIPSGKRKREDFTSQYHTGGYIPQQDGAHDAAEFFQLEVTQGGSALGHGAVTGANKQKLFGQVGSSSSRIPQLDGPMPDPYDDELSTPNIYNYQGVVTEDYNVANTPAPDLQAGTPAVVTQNDVVDDDDDEPLNEDDDDDLDDVEQGDDLNAHHLVLAQFDKVTRTKSRWKCTLKDGIMHIDNKDILFNKATGEFEF